MEKEPMCLNIDGLSTTDQRLLVVISDAMRNENGDKYERISQLFAKRAEMIELAEDLLN